VFAVGQKQVTAFLVNYFKASFVEGFDYFAP
jgi:hypothetical protein